MTIRFDHLLKQWHTERNTRQWVLATIIETQLSTYRKSGAMMLFNDLGQSFGMLSGGCLEGDLMTNARKALFSGKAQVIAYDLRDESDINWQRSVGCGGAMRVLLQPVTEQHGYLGLEEIFQALAEDNPSIYMQRVDRPGLSQDCWRVSRDVESTAGKRPEFVPKQTQMQIRDDGKWLITRISPSPQLMIIGGGLDAVPLARLAQTIGWRVNVVDPRVGNAREDSFGGAKIVRAYPEDLSSDMHADAIVIMSHNLSLDAQALRFAQNSGARYVGILGPKHRRERAERLAGVNADDFQQCYRGPLGLEIGAQLPETIALAILAECHQIIEWNLDKRRSANSSTTSAARAEA